jgi:multidrug efflux pump subunit AcrA (membrane-fusion protein)
MPDEPQSLPRCRPDLVIRCTGEGEYVVKLPVKGTYFRIGEVEQFLLTQLDGEKPAPSVCQAFEQKFGESLSTAELHEFIGTIKPLGLLERTGEPGESSLTDATSPVLDDDDDVETGKNGGGSILFFRRTLFNPDWLLNLLEPPLRFVWTRSFFVLSALAIVSAFLIVWNSRSELVTTFPQSLRWETVALFWVTLVTVTMFHEMAHGLTCKHYGGEVREIGVLFAFFTPCFFCNVSDAWLIPKKSQRLWVTLAGGYCDLCLWALAVFVWRVTVQHCLVNYVAFIVMSICGGRILFNFNPLLRLDGYYLLSDWLEIPNLRSRATASWMELLRWLLWGAERPKPQPRGRALLIYGGLIWFFALIFLDFVILGLFQFLGGHMGLPGLLVTVVLLSIASRRVFKGFFASEFSNMIATRPTRTAIWGFGTLGVLLLLFVIPAQHVASGDFNVRPGTRVEIHAPVAGFVKSVSRREGDSVQPGTLIAELELPDLCSQITRKQAELQEVEATLKRLQKGPRHEEIAEQRARLERAVAWRDLGKRDLEQAKAGLEHEIVRLDHQIQQSQTELNYTISAVHRAAKLYSAGALAGDQYRSEYKRYELSNSQLAQAKAAKMARQADGVRVAEAELARREKELEDVRATLSLMQAGSRPEDIEAETAKRTRMLEELKFLRDQQGKLRITATSSGIIATPRMPDRVGQLAELGSLICIVEDVTTLNVEIAVAEEDVTGIKPGQSIDLKARALPFDTFVATVDRIAPSANGLPEKNPNQNTITVYCHVDNPDGKLKSGMTGVARVYRGRRSIGINLINQGLRYFRTEFWW